MSTNSPTSHHLSQPYASPPVTIVLTIILLVFFFVGFFSIYFCRCFIENLAHTWNLRRSPSGASPVAAAAAAARGLDPSIIQSFPTFPYSSVKGFRREKYGLECAICLAEFRDDNLLRLLVGCCHVFHQECIDLWLDYHKTCPVCRRALDAPTKSASSEDDAVVLEVQGGVEEDGDGDDDDGDCGSMDDTFSIDITRPGGGRNEVAAAPGSARFMQEDRKNNNADDSYRSSNNVKKFPRSHSTGHSISRGREEEDRFTLRLPEHVKVRIARGHNQTESCITFGEFSKTEEVPRSSRGFGEASGSAPGGGGGDVNRV